MMRARRLRHQPRARRPARTPRPDRRARHRLARARVPRRLRPEPLPARDPLWNHPGISITPHSAALTEPRTAVPKIVENVERVRRGETPRDLVDFHAGYGTPDAT